MFDRLLTLKYSELTLIDWCFVILPSSYGGTDENQLYTAYVT